MRKREKEPENKSFILVLWGIQSSKFSNTRFFWENWEMGFRGIVRKDRGNDDLGRGLCNEWKRERERDEEWSNGV